MGLYGMRKPLLLWASFIDRAFLVPAIPAMLASIGLIFAFEIDWERRDLPQIVLSPDGLLIRQLAEETIPWTAVKSATLFDGSAKLAVVFDNDRIREAFTKGNSHEVPKSLLETTLNVGDYVIDPNTLQQHLKAGIESGHGISLPPGFMMVQVRTNRYVMTAMATVLMIGLSIFLASEIQRAADDPLRWKIAAPQYAERSGSREMTALKDIKLYPRDTRVRIAYANLLSGEGRLSDAEIELLGALSDTDALRAISDLQNSGRGSPTLKQRLKMTLAVILAVEGKRNAAKDQMNGLCIYVSDSEMPKLIRLGLCHYS